MEIADNMDVPWMVGGDFNCVLNKEERVGSTIRDNEMISFRRCVT